MVVSEEKNQDQDKNKKHCSDNCLSVFLCVCAVSIVVSFVYFCVSRTTTQKVPENITLELRTDSCSNVVVEKMQHDIVDSLNMAMQRREQVLAERYQHLLEQKELSEDIFGFMSILVAVIVGVLGFWGIHSFKELKENVEDTANKIANKVADNVANKVANKVALKEAYRVVQDYTKDNLSRDNIAAIVDDSLKNNDLKNSIQHDIEDDFNEKFAELNDRLDNNRDDNEIDELKQEFDILNERLKIIESRIKSVDKFNNRSKNSTKDGSISTNNK